MEFDNNKPIYIQIADNICERVLSGEFKPGEEEVPAFKSRALLLGIDIKDLLI